MTNDESGKPKAEQAGVLRGDDSRREAVYHGLQGLFSMFDAGGGVFLPGWEADEVRKGMVRDLAKRLLGPETDFEEFC